MKTVHHACKINKDLYKVHVIAHRNEAYRERSKIRQLEPFVFQPALSNVSSSSSRQD